ncbi:DUF4230 domain-containing protein [Prevotella herbatica]|uniref:DUF4230 domain-containing protein n=1 Tax=Prevotella herbatica TaxID=2801997 RepID=A0ABM7NZW1_9BACT|nr:DUF4230 domain-containing protein [Prevotella herbatica]BCS86036.1 DUF4230 domain-containing protein [Prevotella herbatica]
MKHKATLIVMMAITLLASCNRNKTDETAKQVDTIPEMVMHIQKCSRLYTAEYTFHKIITHQDKKTIKASLFKTDMSFDIPMSERKIAIPMDATVKAYIDFSNFSEKNITKYGNKIEITLPDPRIIMTSSKINHEDIKKDVSLMRSNFSDDELLSYEKQGRDQIIKAIPQTDILERAKMNAANNIIPMIKLMGYDEKNITINFRKDFSNNINNLIDKTTIEHGK